MNWIKCDGKRAKNANTNKYEFVANEVFHMYDGIASLFHCVFNNSSCSYSLSEMSVKHKDIELS